MTYLRNCWYLIAWADELGDQPLSRTILGRPTVVFRTQGSGALVALADRCPHRFAPLSKGKVVGDTIQCGYHGLQFDAAGRCVRNPFSSAAPAAAEVASFPVIEHERGIWIWPGDPKRKDEGLLPSLPHQVDPRQKCVFGLTTANADYRLLSDNLMDLCHVSFLHPGFGGDHYAPKVRSRENADKSITADFLTESMPNFMGPTVPYEHLRNHDTIRWVAPATHILHSRMGPVGEEPTLHFHSAHILTPETEHSAHYFWSSSRDKDSPRTNEEMIAFLSHVFNNEDKPMVEAVQRNMGDEDFWTLNPVLLPTDAGAVRVRRRLAAMIAAEKETPDSVEPAPATLPGKA